MPIDLASTLILPSNKRQVCFLAVAIGLMVDLDIGTEHLRWMGDTRFVLGFLKGVALNKTVKCRIHLDVRESDKIEMARAARERVKAPIQHEDAEAKTVAEVRAALGQAVLGEGDEVAGNAGEAGQEQAQERGARVNGREGTAAGDRPHSDETATGPLDAAKQLERDAGWLTIESGTPQAGAYPKPHTENALPAPHGGWPDGQGLLYM